MKSFQKQVKFKFVLYRIPNPNHPVSSFDPHCLHGHHPLDDLLLCLRHQESEEKSREKSQLQIFCSVSNKSFFILPVNFFLLEVTQKLRTFLTQSYSNPLKRGTNFGMCLKCCKVLKLWNNYRKHNRRTEGREDGNEGNDDKVGLLTSALMEEELEENLSV